MKDFFAGNGYEIVDRDNFTPEEITFANIWGVSDEDMARKAIKEMNAQAKNRQTLLQPLDDREQSPSFYLSRRSH